MCLRYRHNKSVYFIVANTVKFILNTKKKKRTMDRRMQTTVHCYCIMANISKYHREFAPFLQFVGVRNASGIFSSCVFIAYYLYLRSVSIFRRCHRNNNVLSRSIHRRCSKQDILHLYLHKYIYVYILPR